MPPPSLPHFRHPRLSLSFSFHTPTFLASPYFLFPSLLLPTPRCHLPLLYLLPSSSLFSSLLRKAGRFILRWGGMLLRVCVFCRQSGPGEGLGRLEVCNTGGKGSGLSEHGARSPVTPSRGRNGASGLARRAVLSAYSMISKFLQGSREAFERTFHSGKNFGEFGGRRWSEVATLLAGRLRAARHERPQSAGAKRGKRGKGDAKTTGGASTPKRGWPSLRDCQGAVRWFQGGGEGSKGSTYKPKAAS